MIYILALLAGVVIPFQTACNAALSRGLGNALLTTCAVLIVGTVLCMLMLLGMRPGLPTVESLQRIPLLAWSGGILSVAYVLLVVLTAQRIGVGLTTALVLTGQIIVALVIDHVGLLGNPQKPAGLPQILGVALMIGGVLCFRLR